jgi:hypothetical protein
MKRLVASVLSVSITLSAIAPSFAESKKYADNSTRDIAAGVAAGAAFVGSAATLPITGGLAAVAPVAPVLVTPAVAAVEAIAPVLLTPAIEASTITSYVVGDSFAAHATGIAVGKSVGLEAIHASLHALGDTFAEATMLEVGNTAPHFIATVTETAGSPAVYSAGVAGTPGSPAVYSAGSAGSPGIVANRPDSILGIQTATLIQGAAIGLFVGGVLIPWITGTNINPSGADVLVCEGFKMPSGKQYRYVGRKIFEQCLPEVAPTPKVAKAPSIGVSPNTPERPAPTVRPADEPKMAPAAIKRLPNKG